MSIIPNKVAVRQEEIENESARFFKQFKASRAMRAAHMGKRSGVSSNTLLLYVINLIFRRLSMYRDSMVGGESAIGSSKDAVYRMLRSPRINWDRFLLCLADSVITWLATLTSQSRRNAIVIDDTVLERKHSRKTELMAWIHDHTEKAGKRYKRGFASLFMGWTDGATFIPLASRNMSSSDRKLRFREKSPGTDSRTFGGKSKKEAVMTKLEVALRMLRDCRRMMIPATHVLFDSWFSNPTFIMEVCGTGYHCICRLKKGNTKYRLGGAMLTLSNIFAVSKKRPGKARWLLSAMVEIHNKDGQTMGARVVFVRNKNKRKDWIAFLCTDMDLTEEEIIEMYGKRWCIEVFFKTCKSYLGFGSEFHQCSYEAVTAHTTIVAVRCMMLAVMQRQNTDYRRTPGDLFFFYADEAKDITYQQVIMRLMEELMRSLEEHVIFEQDICAELLSKFMESLPAMIKQALFDLKQRKPKMRAKSA